MPPAFVLSQDQTLRKYLTKSFSSSSSFHCSVAFFKHWILFAWLFNFQRTTCRISDSSFILPQLACLCQELFSSFLRDLLAGCWSLSRRRECIIRVLSHFVNPFFHLFLLFLFFFLVSFFSFFYSFGPFLSFPLSGISYNYHFSLARCFLYGLQ